MCTEIEAKLKVDSLEQVRQKLVELGAEFLQEQLQTDCYFDDANANLTKTDRCLRLRREQLGDGESVCEKPVSSFRTERSGVEESVSKDPSAVLGVTSKEFQTFHTSSERIFLTYKGAKEKDQFKKRQEIEIEINDFDSAEKLLSALGYAKVLVFEKKRRTWQLGDCVVALDELPLLGDFVEIEGPNDKKIGDVQRNLGLANLPHIVESYASLIEQKLHTKEGRRTADEGRYEAG